MPNEAEWNYAAAGGTQQRYYPWSSPASSTTIDCTYANYAECEVVIRDVGFTSPQGDGVYGQSDLSGNVLEWMADWLAEYETPCNNCFNATEDSNRSLRSTGFGHPAIDLRSSSRAYATPAFRNLDIRFRCARIQHCNLDESGAPH